MTERIKVWVMTCQRNGNGRSAGREKIEVVAESFGPLAVHRDMQMTAAGVSGAVGSLYTVTHKPTGYAIQQGLTEARAKDLAATLRLSPLSDDFWSGINTTESFRRLVKDPRIKYADECRLAALTADAGARR